MGYKVVGVTACIMGVAHTYLAAEALEKGCKKHPEIDSVKVETQGSIGPENIITQAEADAADVVVITNEIQIKNKERFNNKPILEVNGTYLIKKTQEVVDRAIALIKENE